MSCFESSIKCLSLVPWASLIAVVICWAGTALFCGTGHAALTLSLELLNNASIEGFDVNTSNIDEVFQAIKYAMYGIAGFMFLLSVILFIDGVMATRAVKKEIEEGCRTSKCGLCSGLMFTAISYVLSISWLLMSAFSTLPLYFYQVSNSQCSNAEKYNGTDICIDFVQAGLMPYKPGSLTYGQLCGDELREACDNPDYSLSYQMFMIAFAGSCIVVLSMKHFLMTLSANYAYMKMARKLAEYQDTKFREEMELNDIINTARSNERLTYKY